MTYYCFTKECEFFEKPAPSSYKGGYLAVGFCCCWGRQNCVKVNDEACEGCGAQRAWLDNFKGVDERLERDKFAGTRENLKAEVEQQYYQQKYSSR